ncbi:hypothetical protein ATO8_17495 [Roseivivax marinus]|uniref:Uncharacterized protein n=2 Tax=Roseobacteraceae TaxID=2854170 RepID=A0A0W7WNX5_9RHOB|nr:hypothetical protein ATO8_17495 [Roseivivax marinus]KUF12287.1 hypothetical protein AVJ23_00690 [Pseudoponticoccus marisrubri]
MIVCYAEIVPENVAFFGIKLNVFDPGLIQTIKWIDPELGKEFSPSFDILEGITYCLLSKDFFHLIR